MSLEKINRRQFLQFTGLAAGGLSLSLRIPSAVAEPLGSSSDANLGYFVTLKENGDVSIICQRAEMGQGIITSVPQIIADEMCADWSKVHAVLGNADAKLGHQNTGGSASIRLLYPFIRQMGAVARDMLAQAAANQWGVSKDQVSCKNHRVYLKGGEKSLDYGELVSAASELPMPDPASLQLLPDDQLTITGKEVKLQRQEEIVRGSLPFAQDVQLPNMLFASIQRPPVVGGKVKSFDPSEAKKVDGVVEVIRLKDRDFPVTVLPLSGVAVLAENSWAALEARKKLKIEWSYEDRAADNAKHNSATYKQLLIESVSAKAKPVRQQGDVYQHQYDKDKTLEAIYTMPYHNHSPMETPSATAYIVDGVCKIWSGTQAPQWGKTLALQELGYDPEKDADKVEFNTQFMGGAFGRKSKNDFTIEAVELAQQTDRPVKVIWSREDDIKHGFYHSISANYYKAELNDKGGADNYISRVAHPPIASIYNADQKIGRPLVLAQSFADLPFEAQNLSCEVAEADAHVRIGWFRAVQNIHNAFSMGCFVDELADKANTPTEKMWEKLLGKDRDLNFNELGLSGWTNYKFGMGGLGVLPNTGRMKNTIAEVVKKSGADQVVQDGEGWGISFCYSFDSYAAAATKVRMDGDKLTLLEMHTSIDCGKVITPDRVVSQMEGAMIMGIAVALYGEITVENGEVQQSNFHDNVVARINQVPPLHVHLIESDQPPGGVGEPGMPPVAPSIINAIFHASGKRIRDLPASQFIKV